MSTDDTTSTPESAHIPRIGEGGFSPDGVSLAAELDTLRYAIDGTRILSESLQTGDGSPHDEDQVRSAVPAILTLLGLRLHRLCRVTTGQIDAVDIMAPHNKVPAGFDSAEDIVIPSGRSRGVK